MKKEQVDSYVDGLKFNEKLKAVLKRKLAAYITWKEYTYKEITTRRSFIIKFLRQHYNSIQMYISWVKPYMKNVQRLKHHSELTDSPDIIAAFEGSVTEIELVCYNELGYYNPYVVLNFYYRTRPQMDFHQEGYQHKGPIHVGNVDVVLRGYAWNKDEFESYKKMRMQEELEIIGEIDSSLKDSLDALGDDLRKYLKESGEKFPEDDRKKKEEEDQLKKMKANALNVTEPFKALFGGIKEISLAFFPQLNNMKKEGPTELQKQKAKEAAEAALGDPMWTAYKNYKKAHKHLTW
jgi:hypothetical protein